jgi:hypothetical protein
MPAWSSSSQSGTMSSNAAAHAGVFVCALATRASRAPRALPHSSPASHVLHPLHSRTAAGSWLRPDHLGA